MYEGDVGASSEAEGTPRERVFAEPPVRAVSKEAAQARQASQPKPPAQQPATKPTPPPQKAASGQPPSQSARSGGAMDVLTQHYQQSQALAQARAAKGAPAIQPTYQPKVNTRPSAREAISAELEAEKRARGARAFAPSHYSMGPTGYVGFNQVYGANAATAQRAADALLGRVRGDVRGAYADLADKYKAFQGDVDRAAGSAASGRYDYAGPAAFDTGALSDEFATAGDELAALRQGAGGVQALAPRTSGFGASLAASAAEPESERLARRYSGIDTALGEAGARGQAYAAEQARLAAEQAAANAPVVTEDPRMAAYQDFLSGVGGRHNMLYDRTTGELREPTFEEWLDLYNSGGGQQGEIGTMEQG